MDYYGNIYKDLKNIITNISSDHISYYKSGVKSLAINIIEDLEKGQVGENIIKAELNILINFLYSPGKMDYAIIQFYNEMHQKPGNSIVFEVK
jgi:hypothetical protein